MLPTRPPDFECPWCGPHGVPVNRSLPVFLRLCDDCLPRPTVEPEPPPIAVPEPVVQLRAILRSHLAEWRRPWTGAEFGKAIIGNSILGALASYGCDPGEELRAAVAERDAATEARIDRIRFGRP